MKIMNAFSIQMILDLIGETDGENQVTASFSPLSKEKAAAILDLDGVDSFIGHKETADIVSKMLGMEIPFQRRFAKLVPGEAAIIAQVKGGRLPEGATTLPEGMEIVFILVMVKEHKFG